MFRSILNARTIAAAVLVGAGVVIGIARAQRSGTPSDQGGSVLAAADGMAMTTTSFKGAKVNGGTASLSHQGGRIVLTLSDDFKIPETPAPHWQVVDSYGNVYLLQRLKIKDDKFNKTIVLPAYIHDVAKVQIWCAWAEVLLGEASFSAPVM